MRHRVAHRKLGRVTEHRISMLRNQATALLRHEHLTTTVPQGQGAAPVRRAADHHRQARPRRRRRPTRKALNARRLVMRRPAGSRGRLEAVRDARAAVRRRPGGYTRLLRLGFRKGDSAEVAQVELVGSEFDPKAKAGRRRRPKRRSRRPRASAGACAPRPSACAARRTATPAGRPRRSLPRASAGRPRRRGKPAAADQTESDPHAASR